MNRTVRTVQRWEREQGLPVHRLLHNKLGTVYAYTHEIDRWWDERRASLDDVRATKAEAEEAAPAPASTSPPPPAAERPSASDRVDAAPASGRRSSRVALATVGVVLCAAVMLLLARAVSSSVLLNDSAEQHYRRGRAAWNERTAEGFREALREFERALSKDPEHVGAHAGMADTYSLLYAFDLMPTALPHARAAAERALALSPTSGEALTSLSFVLWEEGHRGPALQMARRAIAAAPNYPTARHWYALYLQDTGHYMDAIEQARIARRLAPDSPVIGSDLSIMLRNAGRLDEARTVLEDLIRTHPTFAAAHLQLAEVQIRQRQYEDALRSVKRAIEHGDSRPTVLARLAWLESKNGNYGAAIAAARRIKALEDSGTPVPVDVKAKALTAAGDFDAAFALLERGMRGQERWTISVTTSEDFEMLHTDPRWPAYRARLQELGRAILPQVPAVTAPPS